MNNVVPLYKFWESGRSTVVLLLLLFYPTTLYPNKTVYLVNLREHIPFGELIVYSRVSIAHIIFLSHCNYIKQYISLF